MLSKAAYAARVCRTCRVQLQLNNGHYRPAILTPQPLRFGRLRYSTNTTDDADRKPETAEKPVEEAKETVGEDTTPAVKSEPAETLATESDKPLEPTSKPRPRRNARRGINHRFDLETPSLGMDILGKPGHTIVLRDRKRKRREPPKVVEDGDKDDGSIANQLKLEGSLEDQDRDITVEEARRNIEELRPSESRDLLAREFDELLNTLLDGFTTAQLEDYMSSSIAIKSGPRDVPLSDKKRRDVVKQVTGSLGTKLRYPVPPRYHWIKKQYSWVPPLDYYWGSSAKEKIALIIMRMSWRLQVMEETPHIGEVELKVDSSTLNFLLSELTPPPILVSRPLFRTRSNIFNSGKPNYEYY